jgi:hypothetical protein
MLLKDKRLFDMAVGWADVCILSIFQITSFRKKNKGRGITINAILLKMTGMKGKNSRKIFNNCE